jgi:hypothetical protein
VTPKCIREWWESNRALNSALSREELKDLAALLAVLNAYRPLLAGHFPVGRRKLWKSCNSESLDLRPSVLPGSKYTLGCGSHRWVSGLSDAT